jgi:hypothetical protein
MDSTESSDQSERVEPSSDARTTGAVFQSQ